MKRAVAQNRPCWATGSPKNLPLQTRETLGPFPDRDLELAQCVHGGTSVLLVTVLCP